MKKYIIFLLLLSVGLCSGCSIDYTNYNKHHSETPTNPDTGEETKPIDPDSSEETETPIDPNTGEDIPLIEDKLTSEIIEKGVKNYPDNNIDKITPYNKLYSLEQANYKVYSSYYSIKSDTIYIAYDNINNPTQTLDSRDLAIMEEHLLFYFESDENKSEYNNYLKAIRIYPDYASSACRVENDSNYDQIQGCANYNSLYAEINLNNLNDLNIFFNPYYYNEGLTRYYIEPRRDTFAHEYGHVSTYYHMILKGDGSYEDYLKLRLKEDYNKIYPKGIISKYDSNITYNIQPTEILADDYVELFYNIKEKNIKDTNDYKLSYLDLRNALNNALNDGSKDHGYHYQYLKDNPTLYEEVKEYYNSYILHKVNNYDNPIVVKANTNEYFSTIYDILTNNVTSAYLDNKEVIVLGEITLNGISYYRTVLANCLSDMTLEEVKYDGLRQHKSNIGYIKKANTKLVNDRNIIYFNKYKNETLSPYTFLPVENVYLMPYYDYSYFVEGLNVIKLYDYTKANFDELYLNSTDFK